VRVLPRKGRFRCDDDGLCGQPPAALRQNAIGRCEAVTPNGMYFAAGDGEMAVPTGGLVLPRLSEAAAPTVYLPACRQAPQGSPRRARLLSPPGRPGRSK